MNIAHLKFQRRTARNIFVGVVNPDNGAIVYAEEWRKQENPTRAQFAVVVDRTEHRGVVINKSAENKRESFGGAQFIAGLTMIEQPDGRPIIFDCPSRLDCMLIYDGVCLGLDNVLALIGGDKIGKSWIWTGESDPDSEFTLIGAFVFDVEHGYIFSYDKNRVFDVRAVASFKIEYL